MTEQITPCVFNYCCLSLASVTKFGVNYTVSKKRANLGKLKF